MPDRSTPTESFQGFPLATVLRWAMIAAAVGVCMGAFVAGAALRAG